MVDTREGATEESDVQFLARMLLIPENHRTVTDFERLMKLTMVINKHPQPRLLPSPTTGPTRIVESRG